MLNFGAALESDEGAQLQLADRTFGWNFGKMRRAKYPVGPDAALVGARMASEVTEIPRSEAAEQLEIDDDARLFCRLFSFVLLRQKESAVD